MELSKLSVIVLGMLLVAAACKPTSPQLPIETTPEIQENITELPEPEIIRKSAEGISMNGSIGAVDIMALKAGQKTVYNETLKINRKIEQKIVEFAVVAETMNSTECIGWTKASLALENRTFERKRIWCGSFQYDFVWNNTWTLVEIMTTSKDFTDVNVKTKNAEDITTITVKAGTFETLRSAIRTDDRVALEWYSPKVPISGIVRLQEDRKNYHREFELIEVKG